MIFLPYNYIFLLLKSVAYVVVGSFTIQFEEIDCYSKYYEKTILKNH